VTASAVSPQARRPAVGVPVLDVVVPVHNEESEVYDAVVRVREHLASLPYPFRITVADNASTDATALIANQLTEDFDDVEAVFFPRKGRGNALSKVWSASDADVLVYMDVDLSTDLNALLPLVAPLISGHSDLAIGTRLARGSHTVRGLKRELISRSYNLLLKGTLRTRFSDAQCGFKAIRRDVARTLLPMVEDHDWFFDTELLVVAERAGLRIHEVPVDWTDDPDSRVDILRTARDDLLGIARLGTALARRQLPLADVRAQLGRGRDDPAQNLLTQVVSFVAVGVLSTVAYALLYLGLRHLAQPQLANALALATTAIANTAANRRFTFGVRGRARMLRHQTQGLLIFLVGLAVSSGALALVDLLGGGGHRGLEIAVLTAANLAVTLGRFLAMKGWVFRRDSQAVAPVSPA
jgi:putative flippase GtrA